MTPADIEQHLDRIRELAPLDEDLAHKEEDALNRRFIRWVATQGGEAGALAELVLRSIEIDFKRYYA